MAIQTDISKFYQFWKTVNKLIIFLVCNEMKFEENMTLKLNKRIFY